MGLVQVRTSQFFDRQAVIRAVSSAQRKVLSKAGAFIRKRARTSIRKRKRISRPGEPPSSHEGTLRRLIYFGYEPSTESVVIGPARSARNTGAPNTLEFGGTVMVDEEQLSNGRWVRRGSVAMFPGQAPRRTRRRKATVEPRPFMRPAMEKEAPNFPRLFANSVR